MAPGIACERRRICGCRFSPLLKVTKRSDSRKYVCVRRLRGLNIGHKRRELALGGTGGMPTTPLPLPTPHRKFWKQADAISSLFRDNFFKNLTSKMTHILSIF